jgi:hypothetical protein
MDFLKEQHLENAKRLVARGDSDSLRYACLELRLCIEHICYERLAMHESELPLEVLSVWQPQRVISLLLECDPTNEHDTSLALALNDADGIPGQFIHFGTQRAISKRFISAYYHRLSPMLHAPTVADQKAARPAIPEGLADSLVRTIAAVQPYIDEPFLSNLGAFSHFACEECGSVNVHNVRALSEGKKFKCVGASCEAHYIVTDTNSAVPLYRLSAFEWKCPACGVQQHIGHHRLFIGGVLKCISCAVRGSVRWGVQFSEPSQTA